MLDCETAYPSVSRLQLYTYLHEQGIQGQMLAVIKSLTKSLKVRVLHLHIPDDYVDIERRLAEGSAPSPRLCAILLGSLLRKMRENFPKAQCTGAQWIGALAYVDDLCLCADSAEELNKMITVAQHWAEDHRAKINYGEGKSEIIVLNETSADKTSQGQTPWIVKARFPYPHNKEVREVDHFKYLGFTLDSKLDMNKQCTDIIKKIKIATSKVLKYARAFKQQSAMHYRQQVTLTIWKAIVHVHSTTNSILLTSTQQVQRVQDALDKSLAECMGLSDSPNLQTALNADCGLLPMRLQQAIELCSLHAKLLVVDQNRPDAQIHKTLISALLIRTASLTERMRCARITLNAVHLWGVPPTSPNTRHRVNRVLALPQPFHQIMSLKTLIKTRKNEPTTLACTQQRRTLLQLALVPGNSPSCPIQQYITATLSDLHRKKLNTPAPYPRTSSEIPTLPLLRARCQNLTNLRSNLYNEKDTVLPYHGIPCLRCNPTALIDQGPLLIHTHHPVDNIHHLATSCVTTQDQREQLGQQFEAIMVELGINTRECAKVSEETKTSLTLASDPSAEWQLRTKTIIQW